MTQSTINESQTWALTCAFNAVHDLRDDFYCSRDMAGSIDAPKCMPSGSTVENVLSGFKSEGINGRYVIGGLVYREW